MRNILALDNIIPLKASELIHNNTADKTQQTEDSDMSGSKHANDVTEVCVFLHNKRALVKPSSQLTEKCQVINCVRITVLHLKVKSLKTIRLAF